MAVGPVPDPLTGQHTLTETEGGVPEALDGLHVEYLRRSREAGLPPPPGDGAPRAQARTGGVLGRSTTAWRAAPPPGAGGPMANSI